MAACMQLAVGVIIGCPMSLTGTNAALGARMAQALPAWQYFLEQARYDGACGRVSAVIPEHAAIALVSTRTVECSPPRLLRYPQH
ncbi:MAG: hypothetical protein EOO65_05425, partial [Methanosarcinales archaeon]